MRRKELNLDLERRRAVLAVVEQYPGLHLSELARRLNWTPMLAEYHLHVLEKHQIVTSIEEDHYRRYYPRTEREGIRVDTMGAEDKRLLGLLRHPVRLHLATYLAVEGVGRNKEMAAQLGLSRPATTYQLSRLAKAGVVAKDEEDVYHLVEPDRVVRLLMAHQPPPDTVESFKALWDRLRSAGV